MNKLMVEASFNDVSVEAQLPTTWWQQKYYKEKKRIFLYSKGIDSMLSPF